MAGHKQEAGVDCRQSAVVVDQLVGEGGALHLFVYLYKNG